MFKKNTRKRLLAGALATVMMLTMCPSWALADDEDIATPLPLVDENRPVVDSAPVEADTTKTPAVPTPSETEAKPAENQNTAPAPSDDEANGGTDSTETGNSTNPTISEGSENNSQKNNVVNSTPDVNDQPQDAANEANSFIDGSDRVMEASATKTIEAEYWITNARATGTDKVNTKTISSNMEGITEDAGIPVTELAPSIRTNINGYETTVFGHARVLDILHTQKEYRTDRSTSGTEIDAIRYHMQSFWYHKKGASWNYWNLFLPTDQLVFYYLVRTDYTKMVQIDVSDWAYDDRDKTVVDDNYRNNSSHYSITYQVIVEEANGTTTLTDSRKFWYDSPLTVSLVAVREIDSDYTITHIDPEPSNLGSTGDKANGEYKFSLDLSKAERDKATVKIYVKSTKKPHQLTYDKDGGEFTSSGYTEGSVYPKQTIIVPEVEKENYIFDGWFDEKTGTKYETGAEMPDKDLTLKAHWTANPPVTPPTQPETELTDARYFVLLPTRDTPKSGKSQGEEHYLPSSKSDGGVAGKNNLTGYPGAITAAGKQAAEQAYNTDDAQNGVFNADGYGYDYLRVPTDLGFFTKTNWSADGKTYIKEGSNTSKPFSVLGDGFNVNNISIVWYTIKRQGEDGSYHVDGYVTGVPVTVTYHSNDSAISGAAETTSVVDATSGNHHIVRGNTFNAPNGYEFGGWYTDAACTQGNEVEVGFDKLLMNSWNLYAKWVPINSEVSYFYKNEQGTEMRFGDIDTYAFGDDVTVRTAHPEKEGYTFTGWANIAKIVTVAADGTFTMPAQKVRFDAQFSINQYHVTYKVDGKDYGNTETYVFNSDVVIRDVPTKEG